MAASNAKSRNVVGRQRIVCPVSLLLWVPAMLRSVSKPETGGWEVRCNPTTHSIVIVIAAAISLGAAGQRTFPQGTCDREGKRLLGQKPVRRDRSGRVRPTLRPGSAANTRQVPPGTSGSGIWMAEALIDTSGKVTEVWPLRELRFTPPFPAFNMAITGNRFRRVEVRAALHRRQAGACVHRGDRPHQLALTPPVLPLRRWARRQIQIFAVGFGSLSHFVTMFRRKYGVKPSDVGRNR